MRTIGLYVSKLFLLRLGICLLGFAALVQLLDLVEVTRELQNRDGGGVGVLLFYMSLRLPSILLQMLPISMLMATLLTLLHLANTNEIVALKSVGVSFYRLLACLLPVGMLAAGSYYLLGDRIAPQLDRKLQYWWLETTPLADQDNPDRAWLRDGDNVLAVDRIEPKGDELFGILLYVRDPQGITRERIDAERAIYKDREWRLQGVQRHAMQTRDGQLPASEWFDEMVWDTSLRPPNFAEIALPPRLFTFRQLDRILQGKWAGVRAGYFYETRWHKKIAAPASLLLMILIAAPVAQTIRRQGAGGMALVLGIGVGFAYFIADGLVLTLGEGGILPGMLAAWLPTLIFASIGGTILLYREH